LQPDHVRPLRAGVASPRPRAVFCSQKWAAKVVSALPNKVPIVGISFLAIRE
jgi:hypothetical protein